MNGLGKRMVGRAIAVTLISGAMLGIVNAPANAAFQTNGSGNVGPMIGLGKAGCQRYDYPAYVSPQFQRTITAPDSVVGPAQGLSSAGESVKAIFRIDRWNGASWSRTWGNWVTSQGAIWNLYQGIVFEFPQTTMYLNQPGYYRVGLVYRWYRYGVQVGEAWVSLELSDYMNTVDGGPDASMANTGAGQEAYCYIP